MDAITTGLARPASQSSEGLLAQVPLQVTDPKRIPARRYYDADFYRLECERLWPHAWQMACRLEEIPEVGDWVEYEILDKSVLVIRTTTGIKAFHNACRHRGVRLGIGVGNCAGQGLVCPFHGWRWNMDGENTFVFGRHIFDEAELDPADLALPPCRVETAGGCAFINLDNDAPPLLDCLGDGVARMEARHVDRLKVDWWSSAILPVNWKLALDAFMEGYHVMATHPQLHAVSVAENRMYGADSPLVEPLSPTESARKYVDVTLQHFAKLSDGMGGMIHGWEVAVIEGLRDMPLPEAVGAGAMAFYARIRQEITSQGLAQKRPVFDLTKAAAEHPFKAVEYFFPNYFLLPMFSSMSSYRVRPLGPESCLFEIWSLAMFPEDEQRPAPSAPTPLSHDDPGFPEIPRQDYSNLPRQQLGLHAGGFEFMRLSPQIEGMISNYQRVIDGFLAELPAPVLAQGAARASGGFDAPIADLGF